MPQERLHDDPGSTDRYDDNLGATVKMSPDVARAVIERAHHHKLPLAAHLFYLDDARFLLQSGADYIAHSIRDKEVTLRPSPC